MTHVVFIGKPNSTLTGIFRNNKCQPSVTHSDICHMKGTSRRWEGPVTIWPTREWQGDHAGADLGEPCRSEKCLQSLPGSRVFNAIECGYIPATPLGKGMGVGQRSIVRLSNVVAFYSLGPTTWFQDPTPCQTASRYPRLTKLMADNTANDLLFDVSCIALPTGSIYTACNKTRMNDVECIRPETERFVQVIKL